MPEIRELSASMINKIAAGEVIERPASVVKELVENSIDSGAKRIEINIEKSGFDLIRIVDNGCGIAKDQLCLALSPHATSKIADADDLFKIKTLGFRGEALASIAEVCQLTVQSRTADNPEGSEIRSEGGDRSDPIPCGMAPGTIMSVRNIFFNVPARRKFLKSPTTEFGHISEMVNRLVVPNNDIHFVFRHNGKIVYELPPSAPLERLAKVFGSETAEKLIYVESRRGDVHVFGYVGHPDSSRANYNLQYFFLNKRFIKDRSLQHALSEAYRGLLPVGRYPVAFLQIEVPPDFVDVNVHPTKMEVRFLNSSTIYSGFLGAIREEFLRVDLRSRPNLDQENGSGQDQEDGSFAKNRIISNVDSTDPQKAIDDSAVEEMRSKILGWAKGELESASMTKKNVGVSSAPSSSDRNPGGSFGNRVSDFIPYPDNGARLFSVGSSTGGSLGGRSSAGSLSGGQFDGTPQAQRDKGECVDSLENDGLTLHQLEKRSLPKTEMKDSQVNSERGLTEEGSSDRLPLSVSGSALEIRQEEGQKRDPVIQIHQRYLVMEVEQGMAVIDQHALHERILYEKIKEKMAKGTLESQLLLVPEAIDLSPVEAACVLENKDLFLSFGLQTGEFGGNTIIISGYPSILEKVPPREILFMLLDPILSGGKKPERTDLLDSMMHQMACKAAIKAGDQLSPEMIQELMDLARAEINSHHCPHGRPSTLVFTCVELDKLFKRT